MSLDSKAEKLGPEKSPDESSVSPPLLKACIAFVLSYMHDQTLVAEPHGTVLATLRAAVVHAEKSAAALVRRYPQIKVEVGNPIFLNDKSVAFNFIATMETKEPDLIGTKSRLDELIRSELRSVQVAAALNRAGHLALACVIEKGLPDLPRVKAAPANQKEIVRIDSDGSLLVTVAKGLDDVRAHRSLLKTAEIANGCGLIISAKLKKEVFDFAVLPPGTTKADWISTVCTTQVGRVTGFLESGRIVEIRIGKIIHTLATKHDECPAYAEAFRKSRYVRISLKTARPGNPFHTDDPKFTIDQTLEFMDDDGQKPLNLGDAKTESAPESA